jgi:endonuclease YncB( thermonuclease family)
LFCTFQEAYLEALFALLVIGGVIILLLFGRDRPGRRPPAREVPHQTQPPAFEACTAAPVPEKTTVEGTAYVVDGDSLVIKKVQIRLFGVDAPEINHPYGQKAKWALVRLCKGQVITAEIIEQDAHGRTVAKCTLPDGRDLSAEMVKLGLAIDWPKFSGGVYRALEGPEVRKRLWLADARQKGQMHVWEKYEARQKAKPGKTT